MQIFHIAIIVFFIQKDYPIFNNNIYNYIFVIIFPLEMLQTLFGETFRKLRNKKSWRQVKIWKEKMKFNDFRSLSILPTEKGEEKLIYFYIKFSCS